VVEWSDARVMNATLGRLSTLLEHPTLCGAETGSIVSHEAQRTLGSSSYLGHNLYASTFLEFERLASAGAGASASAAETGFLALWRECGTPDVVISFVRGERETLRHELCHARFALDTGYRETLHTLWKEAWAPKLHRWMRDLGYHPTRHTDEFCAYVLTEPSAFGAGVSAQRTSACYERGSGADLAAVRVSAMVSTRASLSTCSRSMPPCPRRQLMRGCGPAKARRRWRTRWRQKFRDSPQPKFWRNHMSVLLLLLLLLLLSRLFWLDPWLPQVTKRQTSCDFQ